MSEYFKIFCSNEFKSKMYGVDSKSVSYKLFRQSYPKKDLDFVLTRAIHQVYNWKCYYCNKFNKHIKMVLIEKNNEIGYTLTISVTCCVSNVIKWARSL
jgi:hypothetical protein